MIRHAHRLAWAFGSAALLAGCTAALPAREQCETDADCRQLCEDADCIASVACVASVCELREPFACIGEYEPPQGLRTYSMVAADIVSFAPVASEVTLCSYLDPGCDPPVAGPFESDPERGHTVDITYDFPEGYNAYFLEVRTETYLPALANLSMIVLGERYLEHPESTDFVASSGVFTLGMISEPFYRGMMSLAGVDPQTIDLGKGQLTTIVTGCGGQFLPNFRVEADRVLEESVPWYLENRSVSLSRTRTDDSGFFGTTNVPTGVLRVSATHVDPDTGEEREVGSMQILSRGGWLSSYGFLLEAAQP